MKKVTLLYVFSTTAIIALAKTEGDKLKVTPWVASGPNVSLRLTKPEGTEFYSIKIATRGLQVGQEITIESLKSNRGDYNFLAEVNYLALNERMKAEMAQNEINSTANIISSIKDADKLTANQLIATVMVVKASRKERWGTYLSQRTSNRPGVSAADFSNALTAQDQIGG